VSFSLQFRARRQIIRGAVIAAAGVLLLTWVGCASTPTANRPETWAQPVKLSGVPNLYRVSGELYRGDQPSPQGMQNLKSLGLKTIINLRSFHSDRDEIGDTGLAYEHITMKAWHPEEKEAVRFLKIVTDPPAHPGSGALPAWVRPHRRHDRRLSYRRAGVEQSRGDPGNDRGWFRISLDLEQSAPVGPGVKHRPHQKAGRHVGRHCSPVWLISWCVACTHPTQDLEP